MMAEITDYEVTIMEAGCAESPWGSSPWSAGRFTRAGAWRRVQIARREIVPGWPLPVFARVYAVYKDGSRVLVYSCDLGQIVRMMGNT